MRFTTEARRVFDAQIHGLTLVRDRLGKQFEETIVTLANTSGRIILCGIGKSGIIAKKISATFSSTGTPSFFLHPSEAIHGDLGMLLSEDLIVMISYSGETKEMVDLIPHLNRKNINVVSITGANASTLAMIANHHIDINIFTESCPLNLAPTTSTTATLVVGDALATCLMIAKKTTEKEFASNHPGGSLGRKLLGNVSDEMVPIGDAIIDEDSDTKSIILAMTTGITGIVVVKHKRGFGVITDGDLRRAMNEFENAFFSKTAGQIMTSDPVKVSSQTSLVDAQELMIRSKTHALLVIEGSKVLGILKQ